MAEAVGSVRIDLFANLAEWAGGLDKAEAKLNRFAKGVDKISKNIGKAGQKLTVGLTAPILAFGGFAIKAAADAQDLEGAFRLSFGDMADQAVNWSVKTGDAMHRSTQTIQKTAMGFQALFEDIAPTEQAAADLSMRFTELTTDFAAFRNVSEDEAFQVLSGGLAGAGKQLKRLGIDISDAALKQEAFKLGIAKTNVDLTNQQKVLARASIITKGLSKETGEAARSEGDAAEQIQNTREQFDELLVTVGTELLPVFNQLLTGVRDAIRAFQQLDGPTKQTIVTVAGITAAIGPLLIGVAALGKGLAFATRGLGFFTSAMLGTGKASQTATGSLLQFGTRLIAFTALAYEAGAAVGAIFKTGQDKVAATVTAVASAKLQKLGLDAKQTQVALKFLNDEIAAGRTPTLESAAAIAKAGTAAQSTLAMITGGANAATDGLGTVDTTVNSLITGFGDLGGTITNEAASALDDLRQKIDPIGAALKEFNADMAAAKAAGFDMTAAQKALGQGFVDSVQGVKDWRDQIKSLPPELQAAIAAQDASARAAVNFQFAWDAGAKAVENHKNAVANWLAMAKNQDDAVRDFGRSLTMQLDPMAEFADRMKWIEDAYKRGAISADVYAKAKARAFADTPEGQKQVDTIHNITDMLYDAATGAMSLGDALKKMILDSLATSFKSGINDFVSSFFPKVGAATTTPGGGGFDFGKAVSEVGSFFGFGGTKDMGGPAYAGMSYDIGSGVRERFTPAVNGTVTRLPASGGGRPVTFNVYAKDPNEFRASERQMTRRAKRSLNET